MHVATKWSDTETCIGLQVQVSWGCIHEWRKARQKLDIRTSKAIAIMRTLYYTVVVRRELWKKKQSSQFSKQSLSLLTSCISVLSWKFGCDWTGAIASASVQMRFLQKIKRVKLLIRCTSLEIRKSLEPLLLQIERSQLRWFGHVSRGPLEKLPNKLYLPKQIEKTNRWTT